MEWLINMASSYEEIFEAFKPFISAGIVDIIPATRNNEDCRVKYNMLG